MAVERIGALHFGDDILTIDLVDADLIWIGGGAKSESDFYHSHVVLPAKRINGLIQLLQEAQLRIVSHAEVVPE